MTDYQLSKSVPVDFITFEVKFLKCFHPLCHCQKKTGPLLLPDQFIGSCAYLIFTATFYGRVAVALKFLSNLVQGKKIHCAAFFGKKYPWWRPKGMTLGINVQRPVDSQNTF